LLTDFNGPNLKNNSMATMSSILKHPEVHRVFVSICNGNI
jgi:hypothetical protein